MSNRSNSNHANALAGFGPDVFRQLADTSADGIGMAGLDSRIIYANATLRRLLELSDASELSAHSFHDYYPPAEAARLRDEIIPQVQATDTWIGELELMSPSGAIWQTIQNIFLIRDEHGVPVAFANVITDITERARVIESHRVSQAALDSSINAIAMASLEGTLTYVNQAFADLWRLDSVDDALGRSPLEFWEQPQQAEDVVAALQQAGHWRGEMQALRHDGSTATMQLSAHLVRNEMGQPVCMMSSFVDVSARIHAERELQRSEALLNSVIQQIPAMVFLKRASDLRFELFNRAGEELLGFEQTALLGKSDHDFFPPEQAAAFVAKDQEVLASGQPLDIPEEAILARNGETRILHTRKAGIYDVAGEPTHLLGISLDITEQKRAQEMMAFLARASSASDPDAFFRLCVRKLAEFYGARYAFIGLLHDCGQNVQTVAVWAGEDYAPNFEYNLDGTPCRDVLDLKHELIPHEAARLYPNDAMLVEMGVDSYYGAPLISSSGRLMGILSVMDTQAMAPTPWTAPLLGVFASRMAVELERKAAIDSLRELNTSLEQRVAERTAELAASQQLLEDRMGELDSSRAQLLKSQETLSSLIRSPILGAGLTVAFGHMTEQAAGAFDLSRASIWRLSDDARSIECLDLWESTTRRHSSGLILSAEDYPDYFRLLISDAPIVADDAHTHPGTIEFSAGYLTPLGIASMLDAPIHVNGKLWGVMCFEHIGEPRTWAPEHVGFATGSAALVSLSIEMSLRREAVSSLRTAKDEAERASAAKTEFLSRMSHELRTPLNAILGFSQLLQLSDEQPLSAQQADNVREIHYAGTHLLDLINEVLDLARIESGRLELNLEPLALMPEIERCATQIAPAAAQRAITVKLSSTSVCTVLADPTRLREVLLNLLSNAVKYNREGGSIEIDCVPVSAQRMRVSVRDTGRGLSAEQQARLFRPFERLESAYEGIEGTGIGLALAKQLVEGMQGVIGVDSAPGDGSTFWFELPLATGVEAIAVADAIPPVVATASGSRRRKVLYIEDNPANLRLVQKILATRKDIELLDAGTAEVGLEIAANQCPDLILLDLNLPGMDGFEALRRLRDDPVTCAIPVIAVTANAMVLDIERGRAAGFSDYQTKPINVSHFLESIDSFLPDSMENKA